MSTSAKTPKIVCLIGSARFEAEFHAVNRAETLAGHIVLTVGVFKDFHPESDDERWALNELHLRKIDMCDEIYVVNPGGYIGNGTKREHRYALDHGKKVRWLEEPDPLRDEGP